MEPGKAVTSKQERTDSVGLHGPFVKLDVYIDLFLICIFPYFRMQERQVKEQQIEYAKKILKIQEQLKTSLAQVQYLNLV